MPVPGYNRCLSRGVEQNTSVCRSMSGGGAFTSESRVEGGGGGGGIY